MARRRRGRQGRTQRPPPQGRGDRGRPGGRGGPRGSGRRDPPEPPPRQEPGPYEPPDPPARPEELTPTDREFRGLRLFPFQLEALQAITAGNSVLVAAPTGAGKTLVADYAIERAFEEGWRVVYTSPIKALSNQKYRDFRAQHGDRVGIMTGDVTINPDADLLIMTTEVFRNTLFDAPGRFDDFRFVVHDEIHYLDDAERGTVWEESIIHAPAQMRLVGLSATIPNVRELADWISGVRQEEITVVEMTRRPVPLDHRIWVPDLGAQSIAEGMAVLDQPFRIRRNMRRERNPQRLLDWLDREKLLPVLVFCFSRRDCEKHALANCRRRLLDDDERRRMLTTFDDLCVRYECAPGPSIDKLREMAGAGVAYHHAGMMPVHKEIVERLFTSGLVRVLFATETFALGINMPARTVAFLTLRKFDGEKMDYMKCRSYGQMAGRAGRQGMDTHGLVVSVLDPGFDRPRGTRRVITGNAEPVMSRWNPDYSTILNLYQRMGDRVLDTYEKSFAKFQSERRRKGAPGNPQGVLEARLELLKRTGYIEKGVVTPKGAVVARVNGYEIPVGEWWSVGLFERQDVRRLGMLLLSAPYEPRPTDIWSAPKDRSVRGLADEAGGLIERWRREEWKQGLTDLTQVPHFGLSAALERWLDGAPLADLGEVTSVREGDLVRNFRLLLQTIHQIRKALPPDDTTTRRKLNELKKLVDRDEVDARRQLELGQDPVEDDAEEEEGDVLT